jgi:hypothetical protein
MPTNVRCVDPRSHGTHRGNSPIPATLWSAHGRPTLILYKGPRCLELLRPASNVIGRWGSQKQLIHASQSAAHKTLSSLESPWSLGYVTDRERRGKRECACAQNSITCCFVPCGKLPSFSVGPVGFPTIGTAAYRLIVPLCFGSHFSPPGTPRAQMSRETSGRERENYGREMAEWI